MKGIGALISLQYKYKYKHAYILHFYPSVG